MTLSPDIPDTHIELCLTTIKIAEYGLETKRPLIPT